MISFWDLMEFRQQAYLVMENLDLTEQQSEEVTAEWAKGVYEDTPNGKATALTDLQKLCYEKVTTPEMRAGNTRWNAAKVAELMGDKQWQAESK